LSGIAYLEAMEVGFSYAAFEAKVGPFCFSLSVAFVMMIRLLDTVSKNQQKDGTGQRPNW